MAIRLLHTADWQIGKGFGRVPGDRGAVLRDQRLRTVRHLGELAREHAVDAVLVAGDVFDSNALSDDTLRRTMEALQGFDGPWVLLPGNHDAWLAESVWQRIERLRARPAHVHFTPAGEPIVLAEGRLAVLPAPLARRHEPRDLTAWFDAAETPDGAVRVGLAHGSVTNRLPEGATAHNPVADDRADAARLDYLALGDWHGTLEIAPRTWYAGTPETDSFRSADPGHALLVTLPAPGSPPGVERLDTTYFHWAERRLTLAGREDIARIDDALDALPTSPDRAVIRLALGGSLPVDARADLDEALARWQARVHYLRVEDEALVTEVDEAAIAALAGAGFVGAAVERLLAQREEGAPWADAALQRLYLEYRRLRGAG